MGTLSSIVALSSAQPRTILLALTHEKDLHHVDLFHLSTAIYSDLVVATLCKGALSVAKMSHSDSSTGLAPAQPLAETLKAS
jgi:hypothetical protein